MKSWNWHVFPNLSIEQILDKSQEESITIEFWLHYELNNL